MPTHLLAMALVGLICFGTSGPELSAAQPSDDALTPDYFRSIQIDGFWKDQVKRLTEKWIPHCIEKISDPDLPQGGINNFIDAANKLAGKPHGRHRGYVFSNAWVYNTIESICVALMVDPRGDQEIIKAQQAIAVIADAL